MALKVGDSVMVHDMGGYPIFETSSKITGIQVRRHAPDPEALVNKAMRYGGPLDPDDEGPTEFREYEVNGKWYPAELVSCAVCGSDMICPQCGAEADLIGMLYA